MSHGAHIFICGDVLPFIAYLLTIGYLSINVVHLYDWRNGWPFNLVTIIRPLLGRYSSINVGVEC